jgi:hypothetical protein
LKVPLISVTAPASSLLPVIVQAISATASASMATFSAAYLGVFYLYSIKKVFAVLSNFRATEAVLALDPPRTVQVGVAGVH